ncbi:MAG: hypothetical protein JWP35_2862 [Caulobacter sp.]|nr:hypothetical protein [Caulobacter sp.]
MSPSPTIDGYVGRLEAALSPIPAAERGRIALEIRGHLAEVASQSEAALETSIGALGEPESLARTYLADYQLTDAVARGSHPGMLMALIRISARSAAALVVWTLTLLLGVFGCAFIFVAAAKPFDPSHVGLWIHPFEFGMVYSDVAPGRDVLGWWFIPLAFALGLLSFVAAGLVLRFGARKVARRARV